MSARHGHSRDDALPAVAPLNWHAPKPKGGGEPEGGQGDGKMPATSCMLSAITMVGNLVLLLDRMEPDVTGDERATDEEWDSLKLVAINWLLGCGRQFKASGLTAESRQAFAMVRQLRGGLAEKCGLTAEEIEAPATSTTPAVDGQAPSDDEPGGGRFDAMLAQLGRSPA